MLPNIKNNNNKEIDIIQVSKIYKIHTEISISIVTTVN